MNDKLVEQLTEKIEPKLLSPLVWAYVGDAVYELYIRLKILPSTNKVRKLHKKVVGFVKAEKQADILRGWQEYLTADELDIVKRGRNVKSSVPKNTEVMTYRYSTGFEALIGYLYLTGQSERLWELLEKINHAD